MTRIKPDDRNYRIHSDENKALINKSLKKLGAGRSIVVSKEGQIIAGNGVYEQAQKLNLPVKIIETDGSELIAVRRTDLSAASKKAKELALADNAAGDSSAGAWNEEFIQEDFEDESYKEWVAFPDKAILDELEQDFLKNDINGTSSIFSVTFNFPKSYEAQVKHIIKTSDRAALTKRLLEAILEEGENA